MQRGLQLVAARRHALGVPVDPAVDPNRTGLIGPEDSELMTTVGDLEAKRTTTNPNMAGLIVHLLNQAGVSRGQTIGVACSGSFPALMVAALAAARSIGVRPVVILSLGASSFGATSAQFNLLDIYDELARGGICSEPPAAVSLGGEKDVGLDFETELRDKLFRRVEASGVAFIQEPELQANVARRIAVYEEASGRDRGPDQLRGELRQSRDQRRCPGSGPGPGHRRRCCAPGAARARARDGVARHPGDPSPSRQGADAALRASLGPGAAA